MDPHPMSMPCEGDDHGDARYPRNGPPLGLDDPEVATWAARTAAEHVEEPWAMRLIAAVGAAA